MDKCIKCGSNEINIKWVEEGINLGASKQQGKMSEFIQYVPRAFDYTIICKKEHLLRTCDCCSYEWRDNTLDNAIASSLPPSHK